MSAPLDSRNLRDPLRPHSPSTGVRGPSKVNILMYHSISSEPGPTSISANTFAAQMRALSEYGYAAVSLSSFAAWQRGEAELPERPIVITFDDGFCDFADAAFPILNQYGLTATVFLPTGHLGGREAWIGANTRPRPLMNWSQIEELARRNIDFGGHSVTHTDLTTLSPAALTDEITRSQRVIAERLGHSTETFAPPYGRSNPAVRAEIAKCSKVSVGTRLGCADRSSDAWDIPRIEMHYFRNEWLWRAYLGGHGSGYLRLRQAARTARTWLTERARSRSRYDG